MSAGVVGMGANRTNTLFPVTKPTGLIQGPVSRQNNQLKSAIGEPAKLTKQISDTTALKAAAQKRIAAAAALGLTDPTDVALVTSYTATLTSLNTALVKANASLHALVSAEVKKAKTSSKSPYTPSSTSIPTQGPSGPPPDTKHLHYHYNAPMVKEAYFSPLGVQANPDGYKGNAEIQVDAGSYQDAMAAWKGVVGGRGTIQMDRASLGSTMKPMADKGSKVDPNLYGFKFLYNPNTVNMSWGITSVVNPTFLQQSLSEASPLALGLIQSNISFSVLLNRIEDFKYLDANGLRQGVTSPYKDYVPPEDLKELYKKGTMYDLDYLFKTLMGGSATFVSPLNGTTADRGWLTSIAVELHLGEGLRYRVRVSDLQVAHTMFNSRMVPIMSTASFICTRFYDSATSAADKSTLDTYNSGSLPAKYTTP